MLLVRSFVLWRNSAETTEKTWVSAIVEEMVVDSWSQITAEEEYLLQLKFAEEGMEHNSAPQERWVSSIAGRLRYEKYHITYNRSLPQRYDYTVGWDGLDPIVNYAINATEKLPHPDGGVMWLDLVKTWSLENSRFAVAQNWPADELWICQLRYKYHKDFMDSQEFFDPYSQIQYCVDVYLDWYYRKRWSQPLSNVRTQWSVRDRASDRFTRL